ncbi:hypothetical protein RMQ97_14725 [Maricaulis sp. D1M11]|uniref:hypothetical protein n=1 Tax=Maricaulis sp. D1M11 TaxID=3076117 RepID=UPI0039B65579
MNVEQVMGLSGGSLIVMQGRFYDRGFDDDQERFMFDNAEYVARNFNDPLQVTEIIAVHPNLSCEPSRQASSTEH